MNTPFYNNQDLCSLIGADGDRKPEITSFDFEKCKTAAENITKKLLGCTITIRKQSFILTSLELYYGGIGDTAHDWHRANFPKPKLQSEAGKRKSVQLQNGLAIYLCKFGSPNFGRVDLVIGREGVAASTLIRNVWDVKTQRLFSSRKWGGPGVVCRQLPLKKEDHGVSFSESDDFQFQDTHGNFVKNQSEDILIQKRIVNRKAVGLGGPPFNDFLWNFTLKELPKIELGSAS